MFLFRVEKSRYFRRDGSDVHTDAEISLSQAILGGTIRVQGVYDDQTIQVIDSRQLTAAVTLYSTYLDYRLCLAHHPIPRFV